MTSILFQIRGGGSRCAYRLATALFRLFWSQLRGETAGKNYHHLEHLRSSFPPIFRRRMLSDLDLP